MAFSSSEELKIEQSELDPGAPMSAHKTLYVVPVPHALPHLQGYLGAVQLFEYFEHE